MVETPTGYLLFYRVGEETGRIVVSCTALVHADSADQESDEKIEPSDTALDEP